MNPSFRLSVAPMMDRTDRHFRYLMRLISPNAWLYTEMITTAALLRGDREHLLEFHDDEHPVAIQLGGCDPEEMTKAAALAAAAGYDEVNLNVGCPSGRVQAGSFGVGLMLKPALVAECVAAMRSGCRLPVTVKTRIGVDDQDDYDVLYRLVEAIVEAGASTVIVHARKAWLKGLSPKENRNVPPLDYGRVHRLKQDFAQLPVEINGGFVTQDDVSGQMGRVDGVMLGRAAYHEPMLIGRIDFALNRGRPPLSESDVLARYADHVRSEVGRGTPLSVMTRHLSGLFRHTPGAKRWRQRLSALTREDGNIDALVGDALSIDSTSRYNVELPGQSAHRNARGMQA